MEGVWAKLDYLKLQDYAATFENLGYDDLDDLVNSTSGELDNIADEASMKPGHRKRFLRIASPEAKTPRPVLCSCRHAFA